MKKAFPALLINLILLAAGVLFLFFSKDNGNELMKIVAQILGIVFIIPSLLFAGMVSLQRAERKIIEFMGIIPAIGGLCFGIVLTLRPELFKGALSIIFSILIIILGIYHLLYMVMSHNRLKFKPWHYAAPLAIAIAGVVTLFITQEDTTLLIKITGMSFIFAAISWGIEYMTEMQVTRRLSKQGAESANDKEE